jgi:hypothetical protein
VLHSFVLDTFIALTPEMIKTILRPITKIAAGVEASGVPTTVWVPLRSDRVVAPPRESAAVRHFKQEGLATYGAFQSRAYTS